MLKFLTTPETKLFNKIANIALGFIFLMIWTWLVLKFYKWLFTTEGYTLGIDLFDQFFVKPKFKHQFAIDFFFGCLIAPLIEEVLFRHLPLQIIKATGKDRLLIPTILFTSIVFGLMHQGSISILIQGVAGFIMSVLYLRNNYSYWSSVCLHFLWNTMLLISLVNL
jgi:membrane protease YdiL (CAAX protease family)